MLCRLMALLALLGCGVLYAAPLTVIDGTGNRLTLGAPAQRIVSLAPHITENLFTAGAGERVVGVVDYSDYPEAAQALPHVGSYNRFDIEAIVALHPDLIVAWKSGNNGAALEKLKQFGIPIYLSEPHQLESVADEIEQLAILAGSEAVARPFTVAWRQRLAALRARYRNSKPVSVFYEIWNQPLMTVNGQHLISDVITLCGGRNVFGELPVLAPKISVEAVLAADPQLIVASGMGEEHPEWLDEWRHWPHLKAVKCNRLDFIPPQLLQRHTARILDGAERMCTLVEKAR